MALTLDEKLDGAARRAREEAAEKHFYDAAQPFFPLGFSVAYRNPGHWDVIARECPGRVSAFLSLEEGNRTSGRDGERARAFRIRGELGRVVVFDERWDPHRPHPRESLTFRSVLGAMLWIVEELMQEAAPPAEAPPNMTQTATCHTEGRILGIVALLGAALALGGCDSGKTVAAPSERVIVSRTYYGPVNYADLWEDFETGCQYLGYGNSLGLTPRLGSDGKPICRLTKAKAEAR